MAYFVRNREVFGFLLFTLKNSAFQHCARTIWVDTTKSIEDNVRQIDFRTTSTLTMKCVFILEKILAIFTVPQTNLQNRTVNVYWTNEQGVYTAYLIVESLMKKKFFCVLIFLCWVEMIRTHMPCKYNSCNWEGLLKAQQIVRTTGVNYQK